MRLDLRRAMIIIVGLVVAAAMVVLGLWQMKTAQSHGREAIEARTQLPPVPLESEAPSGAQVDSLYGRQVTVTGQYLPEVQAYAGTKFPLKVVTGFRTSDGRVVAIVRGTIDNPKAKPADPPSGVVKQTGLLLPSDAAVREWAPMQDSPQPRFTAVRLPQLAQSWPTPLLNGYVTLGAADAKANGLPQAPVTLPDGKESSRNAGYALQWWVFAGVAVVGSVIIARSVPTKKAR